MRHVDITYKKYSYRCDSYVTMAFALKNCKKKQKRMESYKRITVLCPSWLPLRNSAHRDNPC